MKVDDGEVSAAQDQRSTHNQAQASGATCDDCGVARERECRQAGTMDCCARVWMMVCCRAAPECAKELLRASLMMSRTAGEG